MPLPTSAYERTRMTQGIIVTCSICKSDWLYVVPEPNSTGPITSKYLRSKGKIEDRTTKKRHLANIDCNTCCERAGDAVNWW